MTDLDRLRTIRQGGKTKGMVRVVKLEEGGKVRGLHVQHQDGRQAAVVRPDIVRYKVSMRDD